MELIVAEKTIAGKRIAEILAGKSLSGKFDGNAVMFEFKSEGKDFVMVPLKGHITEVNFPKEFSAWIGTDLKELSNAPLEYLASEKAIVRVLKKKAESAQAIVIATDADREGESIGVEALRFAKEGNPKLKESRAYFSAITPKDIKNAFSKLAKIDYNLADSADARREIDLLWGAVLTRFLSITGGKMGKEFLSMGRVQGPTLGLIVDREKERLAFKAKDYWELKALFEKNKQKFEAFHKQGRFWKKEEAIQRLKKAEFGTVIKVSSSKRILAKPLPFNTTSFLRSATSLGVSAGMAMNIAESLYMNGFISYPRTDNLAYPESLDLKEVLNELGKGEFASLAEKILGQERIEASKGKESKDHPPIHPVSNASRKQLDERQWRVYELIVRRFLATLSENAETLNQSVEISLEGEPFIARGQTITKQGWKAFYPYSTLTELILPELKEGERVKLLKLEMLEKQTQPPARFSQGALIKLMEELGLGTKCLSGSTLVKVFNSPTLGIKTMEEIFAEARNFETEDDCELRMNERFYCNSLDRQNKLQKSKFLFVSKRKKRNNENAFDVLFADGGRITATEEHPFYCFKNGFYYASTKKLNSETRVVTVHDNSTKGVFGKISFQEFLKKTDKKTHIFAHRIKKILKETRKKHGLNIKKMAERINCSQGNYSSYELEKRPAPLWVLKKMGTEPSVISSQNNKLKIKNPFPIYWNAELARVLAKLIGDGWFEPSKLKKENTCKFGYCNTNYELIEQFREDLRKIFGVKFNVLKCQRFNRKIIHYVFVPAIVGRIISLMFPQVMEKQVAKIPKELYPDFAGAFFDDEGHAYSDEAKLFFSNTNFKTLKRIKKMLKEIGIESRLSEKQFKLFVYGKDNLLNFLEKIPIHSIQKKQSLINMLSKKYKYGNHATPCLINEKRIFGLLSQKSLETKQVSRKLKISESSIIKYVNRLRAKKLVEKKVIGNNKDYPRKIKYKAAKNISETAYALLEEKVIEPKLVTKKIESIKKAKNTPQFVFDITNDITSPNFTLGNNIVVHNSTRAEVLQKLFARHYIFGQKAIEPNKIAFAVIDSLEKHCNTVTKPEMTSELEQEMNAIAAGNKTKQEVVQESREFLLEILEELLKEKQNIGLELKKALMQESIISKCPNCDGMLVIRRGRSGKRFAGCNNYPKCTTSFPLPQKGKIISLDKKCEHCSAPMIKVLGKRFKFETCLNMECKSKDEWRKKREEKEKDLEMKTEEKELAKTRIKREDKIKLKKEISKKKTIEKKEKTKKVKKEKALAKTRK